MKKFKSTACNRKLLSHQFKYIIQWSTFTSISFLAETLDTCLSLIMLYLIVGTKIVKLVIRDWSLDCVFVLLRSYAPSNDIIDTSRDNKEN